MLFDQKEKIETNQDKILNMSNTIAAIILTKDEEKHIERCIRSLKGVCEEVFVIDCFSTDNTKSIDRKSVV